MHIGSGLFTPTGSEKRTLRPESHQPVQHVSLLRKLNKNQSPKSRTRKPDCPFGVHKSSGVFQNLSPHDRERKQKVTESDHLVMTRSKYILALLTFVTIGMIIGSLFQLAFIRRLEESSGTSHWENDKDATVLRLGFVKPEVLNWSPRIILFHNFLSTEECDYLRAIAKPRLQISTVVDTKTGKGIKSDVRTSSGMFLSSEERKFPIIQAIEKRIAVFSQVPAENGELIQVLRYEANQYYKPHHDYFADTFNLKRGGQRIATMLMYLSDNVEGGETYFPLAGNGECNCGGKMMKGLCVKPVKGDAVLFWSMGLNGESDPNSIHGGCAVLKGEKWSATKWMRQRTSY